MKFKFFIVGKIPSKANYKKISHRRVNGEIKPFIVNNPDVIKAQQDAVWQLHKQKVAYGLDKFPIERPVKMSVTFYLTGRVKQRDIDNAEKFVGDVLEKAEVLKRDSLIYLKEKVEKRLGIKGFEEVVEIDIEIIPEEVRLELEKGRPIFPPEFFEFLRKINMEIPTED